MSKIILASGSPRRSDILKQVGVKFEVVISDIDETNKMNLLANELVQELAYNKAHLTARNINPAQDTQVGAIVIGADTVVVKNEILGKPKDKEDAQRMLRMLSGQWHEVLTGVAVINSQSFESTTFCETTRVKIKDLSNMEIDSYIRSEEPFDKAGGYGIQGIGALLVEKIDGCYFNVVGLPVSRLSEVLKEFGVSLL